MSEEQQTHLSDVSFLSLKLHPKLLQGVKDAGFSHCTPIQAQALPIILRGENVAGQAQTGTGKTAAFLLGVGHHLLKTLPPLGRQPIQPRALIVAPTRELAVQIFNDAEVLLKHTGFKLAVVYGGMDYDKQRKTLDDGVDILIGTPGRLIDYMKQEVFNVRALEATVLDEVDRMFDLGFIKDVRYLMKRMPEPEKRLNLLFSATLSLRVTELAYEHMHDAKVVKIESDGVTGDRINQSLYHVASDEKIPLLLGLMNKFNAKRTLIFVNTRRAAEYVANFMQENGFECEQLSGDVPQKKRLTLLSDFQSGKLDALVATDVAARGLHIPEVTHVINYDLPQDAEDYVHRIGRTARAGAEGSAISFACEEYVYSLMEIESYIEGKIPVAVIEEGLLAEVKKPDFRRSRRSNRNDTGRRQSRRNNPAREQRSEADSIPMQATSDELPADVKTSPPEISPEESVSAVSESTPMANPPLLEPSPTEEPDIEATPVSEPSTPVEDIPDASPLPTAPIESPEAAPIETTPLPDHDAPAESPVVDEPPSTPTESPGPYSVP